MNHNVVKIKFVYKLKNFNTSNSRYKARLVTMRHTQVSEINYIDTFALVMKVTFVRTIFALSAKLHLLLYQFDVETVFLNLDVDTDIYVEQSPHFNLRRYSRSRYVCKLNKALYDLHQFDYL